MAVIVVHGRRMGRPVVVTWEAGAFAGDPGAVAEVERLTRARGEVGLVPTGPFHAAGAAPAWRALLTIRGVLDAVEAVETDEDALEPPGVDLEPGAVA